MEHTWPICDLIIDLKINLPKEPIFLTPFSFTDVAITACLLLNKDYTGEPYLSLSHAIKTSINYPIEILEQLTKDESRYPGKLGFLELLFRTPVKKCRRKIDSWYNSDIKIHSELPIIGCYRSRLFKIFGYDRCKFEQVYYMETGLPFEFEDKIITRLNETKTGSKYAVIIPQEKNKYVDGSSKITSFVNDDYRIYTDNEKALKAILTIIVHFREVDKCIPTPNIPRSLQKQIWKTYNGNVGSSKCFVCGAEITALEYECGHIIPRSKGGPNTVDNLLPICGNCNRSMSDTHLFEHVYTHYGKLSCRVKDLPMYKEWIDGQKRGGALSYIGSFFY